MEDIIGDIDQKQLEAEFPLLENLEGEAFSYIDLGEAVWCGDEGLKRTAEALGFGRDTEGRESGRRRMWNAFTEELFSLLCTQSARYRAVRKRVKDLKGQPAAVVVATVSGAIGATLGIGAGIITPFVALLLHGVVSVGLNTMCADYRSQRRQA